MTSIDDLFGERANIYFTEPSALGYLNKAKILGSADGRWLIVVAKGATAEIWINIDSIERVVPQ